MAVAEIAWNYWCNEFARHKGDRRFIANRLKTVKDSGLGLDNIPRRNIIQDIEQTLVDRKSPAGSLEAAIDELVEMGGNGDWKGTDYDSVDSAARLDKDPNSGYAILRKAGLDAVPVLIDHLSDFRVTRCIERDRTAYYQARVADVVARLLNEFVEEKFSYDLLTREGRGKRLDQAHVLHWWTALKGADALTFLRTNAVVKNSEGTLIANAGILHTLGQRYPDELVLIFEKHLGQVENARPLFESMADSKVANEWKGKLLVSATANADFNKRTWAIEQLIKLQHRGCRPAAG